jgi:hypothetical protein
MQSLCISIKGEIIVLKCFLKQTGRSSLRITIPRWLLFTFLLNFLCHFPLERLRAAENLDIKRPEKYVYKFKYKLWQLEFYCLTDIHIILVYMPMLDHINVRSSNLLLVNRFRES